MKLIKMSAEAHSINSEFYKINKFEHKFDTKSV